MTAQAHIGHLYDLLESLPHPGWTPLDDTATEFLATMTTAVASFVDVLEASSVVLPTGHGDLLQRVADNAHDEAAMQGIVAELFAAVVPSHTASSTAGEALPAPIEGSDAEPAPLPDDQGRCVQYSSWLTGVICFPTPNCLTTDLGCTPDVIRVGWCFMDTRWKDGVGWGEGCFCFQKDIPIVTLLALLLVGAYFFGPSVIGPIRVLIHRMAQRGLVPVGA